MAVTVLDPTMVLGNEDPLVLWLLLLVQNVGERGKRFDQPDP